MEMIMNKNSGKWKRIVFCFFNQKCLLRYFKDDNCHPFIVAF